LTSAPSRVQGSSSSRTRRCGMLPKVPGKFRKASGTRNGIQRMKTFGQKSGTDDYYASWLTLQSMPVQAFLIGERPTTSRWPITSINEDRLLVALGLRRADRDQIEGLASVSVRDKYGLTVDQLSSRAIAVFAAMSPQEVGAMQRRTSGWLLRPYPLGCVTRLEKIPPGMAPNRCCLAELIIARSVRPPACGSPQASIFREKYEPLARVAVWGPYRGAEHEQQ
jgi:hypothetical protein